MENLGEFLRQQREDKRVPIEELAIRTRIAIRFIKSIEENRFDQLPNQVSAKGFLRSYARCLGLDESIVLKRFSENVQPVEDASSTENKEEIPSYIQVKRPDRLPFPLWAALSVGGVILLLLALAMFMPKGEEAVVSTPAPDVAPLPSEEFLPNDFSPTLVLPTEEGTAPSPEPPAPEPAPSTAPPAAPAPEPTPAPAPPATEAMKRLTLTVEAVESSWVQVTIDDTDIKEALLQPTEKVKWLAKEKFLLTVGNAGGVKVNLDGQDLGSLGPSGKVVKREIIAKAGP